MGTTETTTTAAPDTSAPFVVPGNLDFTIVAQVDKVHYDKLDMNNVSGTLLLKDETVTMQQIKANALQGTMEVNGSYSTKNTPLTPDITMAYNVQNVDVKESFTAFNTVQKLMPVAQFLSGKITSQLSMKGKLGKDMMPVLSSLTGDGNLLLIEGALAKFAPVENLASTLNVSALKNISLRDIKTYFSFENGRVVVKPFNIKAGGFNMLVGGSHGFDQSLDYVMQMTLPRSIIGKQGDALVNSLVSKATDKGIPVNVSDSIHLNVLMGGNIMKPTYKTDLQETAAGTVNDLKNQAATLVKNKVDSTKAALKDTFNVVKQKAVESVKDELTKQLTGKKDSTGTKAPIQNAGKQAEQAVKNTLGNMFKKKTNTTDSTKH
jgi:hypothetical protein